MKKRIMTLALLLGAAASAMASGTGSNYLTMGQGDTVMVPRSALGEMIFVPVAAHFEDRVERWTATVAYPQGITATVYRDGPDLAIPYTGSQGEDCIYHAQVATNSTLTGFSCYITATGYFDYFGNGSYIEYGSVKWEPGDYGHMFDIGLAVSSDFTSGTLTIQGLMASEFDRRGSSGMSTMFYRSITVMAEELKGDVNGDGAVNITDVTQLVGYLLYAGDAIDAAQIPAADLNGDGAVNITDVTQLVSQVLNAR